MTTLDQFFENITSSFNNDLFVKITLSKPPKKTSDLQNVYIRKVVIKDKPVLHFTYRYKTNDQTKNYSLEEAKISIKNMLNEHTFKVITLFTLEKDTSVQISKKGKYTLRINEPTFSQIPEFSHDKPKEKKVEQSKYLFHLGIIDKNGKVIPKMADKFRQINKYLEIIEGLIKQATLPKEINVVDMGSGKGYLTFALYDFLNNNLGIKTKVTGIEFRKELVDFCNTTAKKCSYTDLQFVSEKIENYTIKKIDVLIALHACDTATDDAIFKGIIAKSDLIICAPCCHKQVRKSAPNDTENPILKHGIFKERQYEMLTDTLRALVMEQHQYKTKVFEFVSNEHTRKNIMLVGVKDKNYKNTSSIKQIKQLVDEYKINHYLMDKLK